MTGTTPIAYYTHGGTVYYTPSDPIITENWQPDRLPDPPCRPRQRRPHSIHILRYPVGFTPFDLRAAPPPPTPKKQSRIRIELKRLASRENAKRVFGTVFSSLSPPATPSTPLDATRSASTSPDSTPSPASANPTTPRTLSLQGTAADRTSISLWRRSGLGMPSVEEPMMSRPSLDVPAGARTPTRETPIPTTTQHNGTVEEEKPIVARDGVACYIILSEPTTFLTGLDHDGSTRDSMHNSTAIVRGKLQLNITKSVKIKAISLTFKGTAKTLWPEGIPPEKVHNQQEDSLKHEVMPFFNALFEGSENGYGVLCNYTLRSGSANSSMTNLGNGSNPSLDRSSSPSQSMFASISGLSNRSSRASTMLTSKETKRLSLQSNKSRSFQKGDSPFGPTPQQKGFKIFHPGVYEYSFEYSIDNNSPETTLLDFASVKWQLDCLVERAGTFNKNLLGTKEVLVVRSPSEDSLELVEPISISRKWEDQLHYEIMISGKSFPMGSRIPIAFKLTPLAKVQIHKLKVYISETVEYFTNDKRVTRKEPSKKILLFEKSAGKPLAPEYKDSEIRIVSGGELSEDRRTAARISAQNYRKLMHDPTPLPEPTDNMLGDIDLGLPEFFGATEIEMNVQLPTCESMLKEAKSKRITHDCTWKNANVHHWIKIVMRISRKDTDNPASGKRRHFEISIDSPFTILNCRATRENLALPEYSNLNVSPVGQQHICGCPNSRLSDYSPASSNGSGEVPTLASLEAARDSPELPSLSRPPQAHLSGPGAGGVQREAAAALPRPMHLLRAPSYDPPAFDEDEPPPPMMTPPPQYDNIVGTPSHDGLADYFARLGDTYDDEDLTDDEGVTRATTRGRVNVANPRTPGGRIARSMDIDRNFMFNAAAIARTSPDTAQAT